MRKGELWKLAYIRETAHLISGFHIQSTKYLSWQNQYQIMFTGGDFLNQKKINAVESYIPSKKIPQKKRSKLRVVLVGGFGVGKSSLLQRFIDGKFTRTNHIQGLYGVQVDCRLRRCMIQNKEGFNKIIDLQVSDAPTRENMDANPNSPLGPQYFYGNANGIMICFDMCKPWTFLTEVEEYMKDILKYTNSDCEVFLIGCKADGHQNQINTEMIKEFLSKHDMREASFYQISAKTGQGVASCFREVATRIYHTKEENLFHKDFTCWYEEPTPQSCFWTGLNCFSGRTRRKRLTICNTVKHKNNK